MESGVKFKAAIIGATGGVGQKIVSLLAKDDRCEEIVALVRKPREEWVGEEFQDKLRIIEVKDLSLMSAKASEFKDCDIWFSCLGSRVGRGKDLFKRIDHDCPLEFAEISIDAKAHAFYLVSAMGAKATSWNTYMKVKGQTEEDMRKLHHKNLCICRPGLLLERNNDERFGEKVGSWIPFLDKITCLDVAKALIEHCVTSMKNEDIKEFSLLSNSDLLKLAKTSELEV